MAICAYVDLEPLKYHFYWQKWVRKKFKKWKSLKMDSVQPEELKEFAFQKSHSFRSKDVVMYNHMINLKSFSQTTDTTFHCFATLSLLTSSALIFCTLRAGSSFFTVLLVLGKCITAVPAAMLEWLWQNLKPDHDAKRG